MLSAALTSTFELKCSTTFELKCSRPVRDGIKTTIMIATASAEAVGPSGHDSKPSTGNSIQIGAAQGRIGTTTGRMLIETF
jgi:hypothetical protein